MPVSSALAQSYGVDWSTIDGGGGTSTGGVYSVSGTIGQPEAGGPMTNGQYSVTGGFWAPATPGFVLQETGSLSPANWTNSPSGATNPIVVPATLPAKFYRLLHP